jgi:hypothetical protein
MKPTIPAAGEAVPENSKGVPAWALHQAMETIDKFRGLENDICRAHNMAIILETVLEKKIVCLPDTGCWAISLSKEEVEAIAFAYTELRNFTGTVVDHFYSVESGESQ